MGIEFLTEYWKTQVGYILVNSARSLLSSIITPICNDPFENNRWYTDYLKWF